MRAVASVGLIIVVAIITGTWLLERAAGASAVPPALAALAGMAVAIGLFALTVRWRIHVPALHIGLGMLMLILGRRSLRSLASRAWGALAQAREISATERAWTVLLAVVAVVHLIVVAILCAAVFVTSLLFIVRWAVGDAG